MDLLAPSWLPLGFIEAIAAMPYAEITVPALIGLLAASVVTFSIPGALTPTAFFSGVLLGFGGILVVAMGAALGSHLLFLASRRWLSAIMHRRFGARLGGVRDHLERRGPIYVAGARLGGVPHLLITAGCAAAPISARNFAAASLLGMLPAITLAASAGSGLALL